MVRVQVENLGTERFSAIYDKFNYLFRLKSGKSIIKF